MISLALILMTLPSRLAEVRAERRDLSQLRESCSGVSVETPVLEDHALGAGASTTRNDSNESNDNQGALNLWRR